MKIARIETYATRQATLVKVVTDSGAEGWGQTAPFHADITAMVLHRQIAPHALGRNPLDMDAISDRCIEANYKFSWSYICRALAGVDLALWDLRGKLEGKPVCELLGGHPRPLPVYGSSMRRDISPQDEANRLARLRDDQGFRAFKIRVGKTCGHDEDQWPGRTEAVVKSVRKSLGDDCALLVDANSCYTAPKAIEVGKMLQNEGVCHFEEPCPYWELEWTSQVAAALEMDVAGGEQDNDLAQWRRMVGMRAVDVVQPDVCYVGGLTRALRVAKMAHDAAIPCTPHSANRSFITLATMHMQAAIPNAGPYVEFSIEPSDWSDQVFAPALRVDNGVVAIPRGAGWGVEVNRGWLEKAEKQVTGG